MPKALEAFPALLRHVLLILAGASAAVASTNNTRPILGLSIPEYTYLQTLRMEVVPDTLQKRAFIEWRKRAVDWACNGATYAGIHWRVVRKRLQKIAGLDMMGPQNSAVLGILGTTVPPNKYVWDYHWWTDCVLGDLSIRWLLLASQPAVRLQAAVALVGEGLIDDTNIPVLLHEAWDWLWEIRIGWAVILASGWPLFSFVAMAAEKVKAKVGRCDDAASLPAIRSAMQSGEHVDGHFICRALADPDVHQCPEALASLYLLAASLLRHTAEAKAGIGEQCALQSIRRNGIDPPRSSDTDGLVAASEKMLSRSRPVTLLKSPWPIWQILDVVGCDGVVNVTVGHMGHMPWFWLYVTPHRVGGYDRIISNHVRAERRPHCSAEFQHEATEAYESQHTNARRLLFVEVGAHFGDCMLWAFATFGPRVRSVGIEATPHRYLLFNKSLAANGVSADKVAAHLAFVGDSIGSPDQAVPNLTLDALIAEPVDVLKIHTVGGEDAVLRGAARLFDVYGVRTVVLHSGIFAVAAAAVRFLLDRGYRVSAEVGAARGPMRLPVTSFNLTSGQLEGFIGRVGGTQLVAHKNI
eukprot:gnl/TRDRNA2_/TRDRNA2_170947_c1_seq4.p1 gnl/TRDRNA2_/TRDRNA2_170947_c1~~gnl/TRDRNA2_/TRDRNA2_170947_c1_seq4.p1  ORF type:complete len:581 (+),score=67.67 gnl/TRDRNA2_/TRDRNA2_170947_c1_seq4:207-1949(+)